MLFRPTYANNTDSSVRVPVWTPDLRCAVSDPGRPGDYTEVSVDGTERLFAPNLARIVYEYASSRHRREELGHDCAVFVVACETNNPYRDTVFNQPGGQVVRIGKFDYELGQADEPPADPGKTVFTAATVIADEIKNSSPHLMVRATADEGPALYLSKLGASGEVVLSTFESMAKFYSAQTAGLASGFFTEPYPQT